jgi:hypothetical protein
LAGTDTSRGATDIVRYRSSAAPHRRLVWIIRRFGRRPSGGLAAATPALEAEAARITVTDLDIFAVKVNRRGNWLFTRLRTSAGVHGIGEASHGNDELVVRLLRRFFDRLKGRGTFEIEWLRQAVKSEIAEHGVSAALALSGLEQCLWDIQGKVFGVPVYELLGGRLLGTDGKGVAILRFHLVSSVLALLSVRSRDEVVAF